MSDDSFLDEIINLNKARHDRRSATKTAPILAELEQAWWGLLDAGGVPRRKDVSAMTMGRALPYGFIAERIAPGHARMRVAGRKISELMGAEARGMPMSCLMAAGSRPLLAERIELVFSRPAILDLQITSPKGFAKPGLTGRLLMMPLRGDTGRVDRAMGALILEGDPGMTPRRCVLERADKWRCDPITPSHEPQPARVEEMPALRPAPKGKPVLRLVVNND